MNIANEGRSRLGTYLADRSSTNNTRITIDSQHFNEAKKDYEKCKITIDYDRAGRRLYVKTDYQSGKQLEVEFDAHPNIVVGSSEKLRVHMPTVTETYFDGSKLRFELRRIDEHQIGYFDKVELEGKGVLIKTDGTESKLDIQDLSNLAKRSEMIVRGLKGAYEAKKAGIGTKKIDGVQAFDIMEVLGRAEIIEAMVIGQLIERKTKGEKITDVQGVKALASAHDALIMMHHPQD